MKTSRATLIRAICKDADAARQTGHLTVALALDAGETAQWVQMFPAGPEIAARDGRAFRLSDPAGVVRAFIAHEGPIAIDYEHGFDDPAPAAGRPIAAAGWLEKVESRADGVWGYIAWTARAAEMIAAREYRFFSPAFLFDPATREVFSVIGGGLVNRPAFAMRAISSFHKEPAMFKAIAAALGLAETSTEAQIVAAISKDKGDLATALAGRVDLAAFVPRADLDQALTRATAAETKLADIGKAARQSEIDSAIDDAVKAGKIAPASREHYLAICKQDGGLENFKNLVATLPSHFTPAGVEDKAKAAAGVLTDEEKAVARVMGLPDDVFLKAKAAP